MFRNILWELVWKIDWKGEKLDVRKLYYCSNLSKRLSKREVVKRKNDEDRSHLWENLQNNQNDFEILWNELLWKSKNQHSSCKILRLGQGSIIKQGASCTVLGSARVAKVKVFSVPSTLSFPKKIILKT